MNPILSLSSLPFPTSNQSTSSANSSNGSSSHNYPHPHSPSNSSSSTLNHPAKSSTSEPTTPISNPSFHPFYSNDGLPPTPRKEKPIRNGNPSASTSSSQHSRPHSVDRSSPTPTSTINILSGRSRIPMRRNRSKLGNELFGDDDEEEQEQGLPSKSPKLDLQSWNKVNANGEEDEELDSNQDRTSSRTLLWPEVHKEKGKKSVTVTSTSSSTPSKHTLHQATSIQPQTSQNKNSKDEISIPRTPSPQRNLSSNPSSSSFSFPSPTSIQQVKNLSEVMKSALSKNQIPVEVGKNEQREKKRRRIGKDLEVDSNKKSSPKTKDGLELAPSPPFNSPNYDTKDLEKDGSKEMKIPSIPSTPKRGKSKVEVQQVEEIPKIRNQEIMAFTSNSIPNTPVCSIPPTPSTSNTKPHLRTPSRRKVQMPETPVSEGNQLLKSKGKGMGKFGKGGKSDEDSVVGIGSPSVETRKGRVGEDRDEILRNQFVRETSSESKDDDSHQGGVQMSPANSTRARTRARARAGEDQDEITQPQSLKCSSNVSVRKSPRNRISRIESLPNLNLNPNSVGGGRNSRRRISASPSTGVASPGCSQASEDLVGLGLGFKVELKKVGLEDEGRKSRSRK